MAKDLQVVSSLSGKETPPPSAAEVKPFSDARMARFASQIQRRAGVVPNSTEKEQAAKDKAAEAAGESNTNGADANQHTSSQQQQDDQKPKDNGTPAPGDKKPEPKPVKPEDTVDYWKAESAKHQSRADKFDLQLKSEFEPKLKTLTDENEGLKKYQKMVEEFTNDPVSYLGKNLPHLAQQLAASSDPVKMVEVQVSEFQKELDKAFAKQLGEDWKFNEVEALRPGTPSFRYRLAIDDKISEIRTQYRNSIEERNRRVKEAEQMVLSDKRKIKEEFGFSDDDLAEVDRAVTSDISYYNVAKAILIDKILAKRLASVETSSRLPPDVANAARGADNAREPEKQKLSDGGRMVLARLGRGALSH